MIYVLYGLDSYLINYNVKKIVKGDDKEYFDLENTDLGSIILSCNSLSLFSNHKNIVVENSYIFTSTINKKLPEQNIDVLDKYIDNINKDVNLIFVIEKDKLDDRKKIVKKINEVYARRRDLMLETMKEEFPEGVEYTYPEGGLFIWVELPKHLDSRIIMKDCLANNVAYVPGGSFFPNGGTENCFRLNYSNMSDDRIVEGIKRIGLVLRKYMAVKQNV